MHFGGYYIVCTEPTIAICIGEYQPTEYGYAPPLPAFVRLDAVLERLSWHCGYGNLRHIADRYARQASDGVRRLVLTNTDDEEADRLSMGIDGFQSPATMHVSHTVYRPEVVNRRFDAIYTARLAPFKRFHLVSNIESLLVLTGGGGQFDKQCPKSPYAEYVMRKLPPEQIAYWINSSGCGLALSEVEGMMRGSMEYLLCGRPVVSTESTGGRDRYYNSSNSIIVDPDPVAVANGVDQACQGDYDPAIIRRNVMAVNDADRYRFARNLSSLREDMGGSYISPERFYADIFLNRNGMLRRYIQTRTPYQLRRIAEPNFSQPVMFTPMADVYIDQGSDYLVACRGNDPLMELSDNQRAVLQMCGERRSVDEMVAKLSRDKRNSLNPEAATRDTIEQLLTAGAIGISN